MMSSWIYPLVAVFFSVGVTVFPFVIFKRYLKSEKYSLLAYFPCEGCRDGRQKGFLIALGMLFAMAASEGYAANILKNGTPLFYTAIAMYLISLVAFLGVLAFGLDMYKAHIISDSLFFLGEVGGDIALMCAIIFAQGRRFEFSNPIAYIMGIVGVLLVVMLFFPQLKRWAMLEKTEEDGKVIYVRPKVSIMALIEWIYFFAHVLNMLLLIINSFVLGA